jgi:hypothetical protein
MNALKEQVDMLKAAALDEQALVRLAFADAVAQFALGTIHNRTPADSIRVLDNWRRTFEKLEHRS